MGTSPRSVQEISGFDVQRLLFKLDNVFPLLPTNLPLQELTVAHQINCSRATNSRATNDNNTNEKYQGKHGKQEESIVEHLLQSIRPTSSITEGILLSHGNDSFCTCCNHDINDESTHAIEYGAGNARLSERLQQATHGRWSHTMIDRKQFRPLSTRDRYLQSQMQQFQRQCNIGNTVDCSITHHRTIGTTNMSNRMVTIERIVDDIANYDIPIPRSPTKANDDGDDPYGIPNRTRICCLSKHLCGSACDLAIASLSRAIDAVSNDKDPFLIFGPCCFVTCCHYLCTWETFGLESQRFWTTIGLDVHDFITAAAVSQWASMKPSSETQSSTSTIAKIDSLQACEAIHESEQFERDPHRNEHYETASDPTINVKKENGGWIVDLFQIAHKVCSQLAAAPAQQTPASTGTFLSSLEFEGTYSRDEKIRLGQRVKILLDLARAAWLQQLGYRVKVVKYTTNSLEDRLLVASDFSWEGKRRG
jgi:hypothetical protein